MTLLAERLVGTHDKALGWLRDPNRYLGGLTPLEMLETEVGTQLMTRSAQGVELTAAGKAFLDHARMVLLQADAAKEAALRAAQPPKSTFAL